jgi:hypothetical protein
MAVWGCMHGRAQALGVSLAAADMIDDDDSVQL